MIRPELGLSNRLPARQLSGAASANEMRERLVGLTEQQGPRPDDVTVLVAHCTGQNLGPRKTRKSRKMTH